jgi:hypothetical protein
MTNRVLMGVYFALMAITAHLLTGSFLPTVAACISPRALFSAQIETSM